MSLWTCPTHGLTGPVVCCPQGSRAVLGDATTGASGAEKLEETPDEAASMPPPFTEDDVTFLRYEAKYAREMHGDLIAEAFDFDDLANRIAASLTPPQYCPPLADPVKAPVRVEVARVYGIPVVSDPDAPPGVITLRSVTDGHAFRFTYAELDELMPGWRATLAAHSGGWPARDGLPAGEPDC